MNSQTQLIAQSKKLSVNLSSIEVSAHAQLRSGYLNKYSRHHDFSRAY